MVTRTHEERAVDVLYHELYNGFQGNELSAFEEIASQLFSSEEDMEVTLEDGAGFRKLVEFLAEKIDKKRVHLSTMVEKIEWGDSKGPVKVCTTHDVRFVFFS